MKYVLSLIVSLFLAGAVLAEAPRPNILYFYVDDMGWGAIGPNGQFDRKENGEPYLRTPTLDKLAAEGVNFTRAYGCSVCSPARSSQQSGFHQGHTFADWNDPDNAKKAMRADEVLMGDALSKAGYVTGYWGKWGYGGSKDMRKPEIVNVQTLPTSHGYTHVVAELHHVRAHTFFQPTLWTAPANADAVGGLELKPNSMTRFRDKTWPELPARQNHSKYPETAYCDDVYSFAALDFVREQARNYRETGQPFFGLLGVQIPHAPFGEIEKLPEWDAAYRDHPHWDSLSQQSKQWAAMVTRIDAHFGNILDALEDPNGDGDRSDSISDSTLVIFQSDNGGPNHPARKEFAANGGLQGAKGGIHEGGLRIPTLMRWPGRIEPGSSSDRVLDVTDLLPTFCELAGVPAPVGLDGVSIAPTLSGRGHQREREFVVHETPGAASIIRGRHKLIRAKKTLKLYDLETDPAETNNLAKEHPKLVEELETLLLGERVTEPSGFANTYHHWTGEDGGKTSDPENWSDYVYENTGITYLSDDGAPRLSWTAVIARNGSATADTDLEFLGLEIGGKQKLVLEPGINITGRNEIRISKGGSLEMDGGTVSSLRWVEVLAGGQLTGHGKVDANLFNDGELVVDGLDVRGDFRASPGSVLDVAPGKPLCANGAVHLDGELRIRIPEGAKKSMFPIISGSPISGKFTNPNQEVRSENGARFRISYDEKSVSITRL